MKIKELIINDETPIVTAMKGGGTEGGQRGLLLPRSGKSYGDFAAPFPSKLLIPRSEWQARIQEMEETKSRTSDIIRYAKLPHKDQANTNYCWINAPTHCVEVLRLMQNQKKVILSPASAGAQIKNYRNVGGWGLEALQWIIKYGLVPVEYWPANAIDRRYATAENKAIAMNYRVDEWIEAQPRNLEQMVSLLLRRIPCAAGLNWWGHEVCFFDPVWLDGDIAIRFRNSWAGYGDFGFAILQGSRMFADDLVCPISTLAS